MVDRPPYGHKRRADGKLELDPITAPVLRRIATMAAEGSGAVAIARTLNAEGIPGPTGKQWNQMTVAALLRNPVLCGWMPAHGDRSTHEVVNGAPVVVVEGPTIMSVAERQRMRAVVGARSPKATHGKRVGGRPSNALLRSILHCSRCGETMTPNGKQYVCTAARTGRVCDGLTGTMELADATVAQMVLSHLAALDPEVPEELAQLVAVAERWMPTADDGAEAQAQAELEATQP